MDNIQQSPLPLWKQLTGAALGTVAAVALYGAYQQIETITASLLPAEQPVVRQHEGKLTQIGERARQIVQSSL